MVRRIRDTVVILPTLNEAENLRELLPKLEQYDVDILVVDDSPNDETERVAKELGAEVMHRRHKRGLSSATLDGIRATTQRNVVIMDADLQHPPEVVPKLVDALNRCEVVVASRCILGGSYEGFTLGRRIMSVAAKLLAAPLVPGIKDNGSNFFGFRREVLNGANLRPTGYKLGLEVFVKGRYSNFEEVPYTFCSRREGESKLRARTALSHLAQLAYLYLYKFRILRFMLVGASGTVIGLGSLYALTEFVGLYYLASYVLSFVLSVTNNYVLNSLWTFGKHSGVHGWMKYVAVSALTLSLNTVLVYALTEFAGLWYMFSAALGILSAFVLNYLLSRRFVWKD